MSVLGDRILMTIIAGTVVAGFIGYFVTGLVGEMTGWQMRVALPAVVGFVLLVAVFVIWEGLDRMD